MSAVFITIPHTEAATCLIVGANAPCDGPLFLAPFRFSSWCLPNQTYYGIYLSTLPKLPHKQKPHVQIFTPVDHSNRVAVTGLILFNCLHKEHRDVCPALILTLTVGSFTTNDFLMMSCVILNGTKRFDSPSPPPSVTTVEVFRAKEDGGNVIFFFF